MSLDKFNDIFSKLDANERSLAKIAGSYRTIERVLSNRKSALTRTNQVAAVLNGLDILKYKLPNFDLPLAHYQAIEKSLGYYKKLNKSFPIVEYLQRNYDLGESGDTEADPATSENNEEISAESKPSLILLNDALRVRSIISAIHQDNEEIFKIRPRDFEEVIAELFRSQGFQIELTKQTKDGGYDIIAIQELGSFNNRYLVECKRYAKNRPVGIEIVRSFMDVIDQNDSNKGIICTTSYFSPEVVKRQLATPYGLELRDRIQLLEWVENYLKQTYNSGRNA